jgi:hypothetical protein
MFSIVNIAAEHWNKIHVLQLGDLFWYAQNREVWAARQSDESIVGQLYEGRIDMCIII